VIGPGEHILLIVPYGYKLTFEAKIPPQSIDQVAVGQAATIRFSAFNQRTTPEIEGVISRVSADIEQDRQTGATYYTARIAIPDEELMRLDGLKLVPGMPAETFIQTDRRTVLSYLVQPIREQVTRSMRER
jgi:HlyD family secretion protein